MFIRYKIIKLLTNLIYDITTSSCLRLHFKNEKDFGTQFAKLQ